MNHQDFVRLVLRLQNLSYQHGQIDAEDRWSDKKYQAAAEAADAARQDVIATFDAVVNGEPK